MVSVEVDGVSYAPEPDTLTMVHHYSDNQQGVSDEVKGEVKDGSYQVPVYLIALMAVILTVAVVATVAATVSTAGFMQILRF